MSMWLEPVVGRGGSLAWVAGFGSCPTNKCLGVATRDLFVDGKVR